jgi:Fe-S-cluster containining protein
VLSGKCAEVLARKRSRMHLIAKSDSGMGPGESGAGIVFGPQEDLVRDAYLAVDEATACELERLRSEEGIVPTCRLGCSCCCHFHIPVNIAEAQTLARYIKRELSPGQIRDLRTRTQRWHEWEHSRPSRYPLARLDEPADSPDYDPCCPLLVDGVCSVYPVRPVVCRTHFVRSHPASCCAANDPESTEDAPLALLSVVATSRPFVQAMKDEIESAGLDFSRSIMLLPHWLAIEMAWDFGLSP